MNFMKVSVHSRLRYEQEEAIKKLAWTFYLCGLVDGVWYLKLIEELNNRYIYGHVWKF